LTPRLPSTILSTSHTFFRQQSDYQEIIIADAPMLGRALFLDGVAQFMQHDEFIYHEHVAILPLLFHPTPHRVLILGGGDGLALRDVLRDPRVAHVTLVDTDAQVSMPHVNISPICTTTVSAIHARRS
jgi:spermidine synthase